PGLGHGEAQQGPGAVPVVVDDADSPDPDLAVGEDLPRPGSEPQVGLAPDPVPAQQSALGHPAQRRPGGGFGDADAREHLQDAAGGHAHPAAEHMAAEEGEEQRLGADVTVVVHHEIIVFKFLTIVIYLNKLNSGRTGRAAGPRTRLARPGRRFASDDPLHLPFTLATTVTNMPNGAIG